MTRTLVLTCFPLLASAAASRDGLEDARDRQDRAALQKIASDRLAQAEGNAGNGRALYQAAVAHLYLAEVALEVRDRNAAKGAAETGIRAAEKAVALQPANAEYHRVLGTLCGQIIPANVLAGFKYGRCAMEEVNKAVELAPKSAEAFMSRGVGNYYLPASFGGGPELALKDLERAAQLGPKSSDVQVWLGLVLRKLNRNTDARKAFQRALELNPNRLWAKQQLEKTPAP